MDISAIVNQALVEDGEILSRHERRKIVNSVLPTAEGIGVVLDVVDGEVFRKCFCDVLLEVKGFDKRVEDCEFLFLASMTGWAGGRCSCGNDGEKRNKGRECLHCGGLGVDNVEQ